jgi:hypothetical protein
MWSLLASLINSFLLLRDFFGYVIPGAVLWVIVAYSFGLGDRSQLPLPAESIWVGAVAAITASYVLGHVLAAAGYSLYEWFDAAWHRIKHPKQAKPVTNTETNTIYYRYLYPSMFIEADRRETLTILRVALAVALLIGACFLRSRLDQGVALAAGAFMLWNGYMSRQSTASCRNSTIDAARLAKANNLPIFHWGGDGKTADGEDHDQDSSHQHAAGKAEAAPRPPEAAAAPSTPGGA